MVHSEPDDSSLIALKTWQRMGPVDLEAVMKDSRCVNQRELSSDMLKDEVDMRI